MRGWSHRLVLTPSVDISGCNSVKSGGPTSICEQNPQQFHSWNRMESLVWSGHECTVCQSLHVRGRNMLESGPGLPATFFPINCLPNPPSFCKVFRKPMVDLGFCAGAWDKSVHDLRLHRITVTWGGRPSQGARSHYPLECIRATVEFRCTPRQLPRCSPGTHDHFNSDESVILAQKLCSPCQVHMITSTATNLWFLRRNYTCDISFLSVRQIFFGQNRSKVHLRFRMWGPLYTVYKWPWPMKLWRPLNLVRRPYHGNLKLVFLWSWALRCRVKTYMTGLSTKWYFIIILSIYILSYDLNSRVVRF